MVQHALLAIAAIAFVLGVLDCLRTRDDRDAPLVSTATCPLPAGRQLYVRLDATPASLPVIYRLRADLTPKPLDIPLVAYGSSAIAPHVIVRALPAIVPRRATSRRSRRDDGEPPPRPLQAPVYGLLCTLPPEMVPASPRDAFRRGADISVLDDTVVPPDYHVPLIILALAGLALYVLNSAPDEDAPAAATAPGWEPFHRIEPVIPEAMGYVAVVAMMALLLVGPRYLRIGGPHLYDSLPLAVLYAAIAGVSGHVALRKATRRIGLSPAGLDDSAAPRIPWETITRLHREPAAAGDQEDIELTLETPGRTVSLELGPYKQAAPVATRIAMAVAARQLATYRERLSGGEILKFEGLRVNRAYLGWDQDDGYRKVEFNDLERVSIQDGELGFRLLAAQWDAFTCRYQELPDGYLLPALLAPLIHPGADRCQITWEAQPLTGTDAWLEPVAALGRPAPAKVVDPVVELNDAAIEHHAAGRHAEAAAAARRAVELVRGRAGASPLLVARVSNTLAGILAPAHAADAVELLDVAIEGLEKAAGAGPTAFPLEDTDALFHNVLSLLAGVGAADRLFVLTRVVDFYRTTRPKTVAMASWLQAQARVAMEAGDPALAARSVEEAANLLDAVIGPEDERTQKCRALWAELQSGAAAERAPAAPWRMLRADD